MPFTITKETIKQDRQNRSCKGDDCELNHCPKCGAHTMGWLEPFQMCSQCEMEEEYLSNPPKCERCQQPNDLAGRFCSVCLDAESA